MERIPCEYAEGCTVFLKTGQCFEDVHHTLYPRRDYKTPLEKTYRELESNKIRICRMAHNALHATGIIPPKPDRAVMVGEMKVD